jgi:hypothetical protein
MDSSEKPPVKYSRGIIAPMGLQNSSWSTTESYLQHIFDTKLDYGPFNYLYLDMSAKTGDYSAYYFNNNNSESLQRLNQDEKEKFVFAVSNSDPNKPFKKVEIGKQMFQDTIDDFSVHRNEEDLVSSIIYGLLQNEKENYPDETLRMFMESNDDEVVKGVSKINAEYSKYWKNAYSRTSTLILVDYDDNVHYYEYYLTSWKVLNSTISSKEWKMNKFNFELKPLYRNSAPRMSFGMVFSIFSMLFSITVTINRILI